MGGSIFWGNIFWGKIFVIFWCRGGGFFGVKFLVIFGGKISRAARAVAERDGRVRAMRAARDRRAAEVANRCLPTMD